MRLPPLPPNTAFADAYTLILLIDQREQFERGAAGPSASRTDSLAVHLAHFSHCLHDRVEARNLPVGDAVWVARCRQRWPGGPPIGTPPSIHSLLRGCRLAAPTCRGE